MHRTSEELAPFLPLTAAEYAVLLALADGDKHGYALLQEVSRLSEGRVRLSASTLYSVVGRLEGKELIRESAERPDPALDDRRRRYFRLTDLGRDVTREETSRLEVMLAAARDRKLGGEAAS